jgi:hypothetical protein
MAALRRLVSIAADARFTKSQQTRLTIRVPATGKRMSDVVRTPGSKLRRGRFGASLAAVFLSALVRRDGRSLGERLVAEGLARRWDGARRSWCG